MLDILFSCTVKFASFLRFTSLVSINAQDSARHVLSVPLQSGSRESRNAKFKRAIKLPPLHKREDGLMNSKLKKKIISMTCYEIKSNLF